MKYQFQMDYRAVAPMRDTWEAAVADAVGAGYAVWIDDDEIMINSKAGATIERIHESGD